MARTQSTAIESHLVRLLPSGELRRRAREIGLVQRLRKVDIVALVWTLVLGFGAARERTLAGLRRLFEVRSGRRLVPSAFYDRLTPKLAAFLRELVALAIDRTAAAPGRVLRGRLAGFKDLLAADSTVIRLADHLKGKYPACRTNHTLAAAKLHMVMSVKDGGPRRVRVTGERSSDGVNLVIGSWVASRLLLFDLGYYRYQTFANIVGHGGSFVSRMKENANPVIVAERGAPVAASDSLVGRRLQDVIWKLRRRTLDVDVEVSFKRRTYRGRKTAVTARFRLVAVRNSEDGHYHVYLTDVPAEILSADDVARVYGLRWEIELLFKELKGSYRLADLPSAKQHVVLALLYASMLSLIASRVLLRALSARLRPDQRERLRWGRWGIVLQHYATLVLEAVLRAAGARTGNGDNLARALAAEAIDPNASRGSLFSRAEHILAAAEGA